MQDGSTPGLPRSAMRCWPLVSGNAIASAQHDADSEGKPQKHFTEERIEIGDKREASDSAIDPQSHTREDCSWMQAKGRLCSANGPRRVNFDLREHDRSCEDEYRSAKRREEMGVHVHEQCPGWR